MPPSATLLLDWFAYRDKCFTCAIAEEGDARVGVLEEYLNGLLACLKDRNRSRDEITRRQMSLLLADEKEERRFMEEDAHMLAHRLFQDATRSAVAGVVAALEEDARDAIEQEYIGFALKVTETAETLGRKGIATELLDSIFLKLCQTQPQWMWRRLDGLAEESTAAAQAAVTALCEAEEGARSVVIAEYHSYVASTEVALASAEKQFLYQTARAELESRSARQVFEESSAKIQAAFRGWQARRAYRTM